MRFSLCVRVGAVLCVVLAPIPAVAGKLVFAPSTFQVYGGLTARAPTSFSFFRRPSANSTGHRTVAFETAYPPGSIIVRTAMRRLYYVLGSGQAIEYQVGVGREGFEWSGVNRVSRMAEWPDWRPPQVMIEREAAKGRYIPAFMPGGTDNPLGARAIYIGNTEYRIHGTTDPQSIGKAMSSGCIRLMNEEVIDLYNRVAIGALVAVE
ncbi:MAG: L,D-transpeptidase [Rhizobiales bacterium]|nr:L,D-transpeptidase [Hyphomicrobiales bacterium]MBI3673220.1 L,D-transpeptidase [Hyphomicrobiales bacterium]